MRPRKQPPRLGIFLTFHLGSDAEFREISLHKHLSARLGGAPGTSGHCIQEPSHYMLDLGRKSCPSVYS